ncbi:MAG: NAD(P)H-hydrate dehydratase [Acidobacteriota bacterium]|nr:NAD(P)H-hydrate dehydratase [Acidobacteriota bacterium]
MQKVLPAAEMREVDRLTTEKYGIPSLLLMENAAHAAARIIIEKLGGSIEGKSFLILCSKGNNGGDGAALARILWTQGAKVNCYLFSNVDETKGDARVNFEILKKRDLNDKNSLFFSEIDVLEWETEVDWTVPNVVVDALFGTGLNKALDYQLRSLADTVKRWRQSFINNRHVNKPIFISLDLPSGLNSDLAQEIGVNVHSDLTITFTAPKPANVLPPASRFNGELFTVNIGSPQELIDNSPSQLFISEKYDAIKWLDQTRFTPDSHKTKRGRALIIAGSRDMPGAASLAANSAMESGLGLVRVATPKSAQTVVAARTMAECMVAGVAETEAGAISHKALDEILELSEKADVATIGSGLTSDEETTRKLVREFVERRKFPVVIDADGLNSLAPFDLKGSDEFPIILTPHIGEMRRLFGDEAADFSDAVKIAREFAQKHHIFLVLKGERSLVAAPDGRVVVNPTGNSALGKAGAGDNLCGIITGFLAQSYGAMGEKADVFLAVVAALYISGRAGDIAAEKIGQRTMTATDVREFLAEAFLEFEK